VEVVGAIEGRLSNGLALGWLSSSGSLVLGLRPRVDCRSGGQCGLGVRRSQVLRPATPFASLGVQAGPALDLGHFGAFAAQAAGGDLHRRATGLSKRRLGAGTFRVGWRRAASMPVLEVTHEEPIPTSSIGLVSACDALQPISHGRRGCDHLNPE